MFKSGVTTILASLFFFVSTTVLAAPTHRGFQVALSTLNDDQIQELSDFWGVNVVRVLIAFDGKQDDIENMTDYNTELDASLAEFDALLSSFCTNDVEVILALYSPPGGFADRAIGGGFPQHKVFTQSWAQEGLIDTWEKIAAKYKDAGCIHAYDLLNEPAEGTTVGEGLKSWNELIPDLVQAVRAIDDTTPIMVKPVYANAGKLRTMGKYMVENFPQFFTLDTILSVHAYPDVEYVHTGLDGIGFNIKKPSKKKVVNALMYPLAKYLKQHQRWMDQGLVEEMPKISIGEFAVIRWATDADEYLDQLIKLFEGEESTYLNKQTNKLCRKKPRGKKRKNCMSKSWRAYLSEASNYIQSWINHGYREYHGWSPEHSNDPDDQTPILPPSLTDRGEVLKGYFSRNAEE